MSGDEKATLRALTVLYPLPYKPFPPELRHRPWFSDWQDKKERSAAQGPSAPLAPVDDAFEGPAPYPPYCTVDQEVSAKKGRTVLKYWFENPNSLD